MPGTLSPPPPPSPCLVSAAVVDCWELSGKEEGRKQRAAQNEGGKWVPQTSTNDRFYLPLTNRKKGTPRSLSRV